MSGNEGSRPASRAILVHQASSGAPSGRATALRRKTGRTASATSLENERGRSRKDECLRVEPDERPGLLLDEALDLRGGEDLPRVREAPERRVALESVRGDAGPVPERRRLLEDGVDDDVDGGVGERPAEPPERVDEKARLARLEGLSTDVAKTT